MSKLARDNRNADLARIHAARRDLGMSEDDYRAMITAVGRAASGSSRDLDFAGRARVLEHLQKKCGWKPVKKPFGQPEKIAWLWGKLGKAGALRDASQAGLRAFVCRTGGVDVEHLRFLPSAEATKVIEALKAMLARSERAAHAGARVDRGDA